MYIATVIPLTKGFQREELTYFTGKEISIGSIVHIPLRKKIVDGIVINIEDASDIKSEVKGADFELRKIESVVGPAPFAQTFFTTCEKMKDYSLGTTGNVVNAMLPALFLERYSELVKVTPPEITTNGIKIKNEKVIFQALLADRLSWYRTLIRESFAKKESVFICVPTAYDINHFYTAFSKGIEKYVYKFHSDIPKKTLIADYNTVVSESHPVLIVGTGPFLSIPRHDIKTIIIEHESAGAYKQMSRPFIDMRTFAEVMAGISGSKYIIGDTLLRPETLHRHDTGELGEVASPLFRLPTVERQIIVDMTQEVDEKGLHTFSVFGETTKKMISYALDHKENIFLFTLRKGLAGVTVCHDCGHTLLCSHCSAPVVLYGSKQKTATKDEKNRIFMCNKCGRKETTETRCPKCESWNLTPLGIGTDRVVEELKELYGDAHVVQIDKETANTEKEIRILTDSFYEKPGSILVGTEMAFASIRDKVTHSAIISIDGLLSIPSFNINQKMLHIIEKLHSVTERNLLIQTRISDNTVLKHVLSGNVLPLYREDLKEREQYGYPPFKRLIKITFRGTAKESEKAREYLESELGKYDPQIFSAFIGKVRGEYVTNTVIKLDPKIWALPFVISSERDKAEHEALFETLRSLPPSFSVNTDPEDLL